MIRVDLRWGDGGVEATIEAADPLIAVPGAAVGGDLLCREDDATGGTSVAAVDATGLAAVGFTCATGTWASFAAGFADATAATEEVDFCVEATTACC